MLNSKQTHADLRQAFSALTLLAALSVGAPPVQAQPPAPATAAEPADTNIPPPTGKVLFSRDANSSPDSAPEPSPPATPPAPGIPSVTGTERSSLTFTAYDLDVHLTPASSAISVRAGLTLRNDGASPLARLVLQISSSLHWDAISLRTPSNASEPLPFAVQAVATDADHTGQMQEAVVNLPQPLPPGASISLTTLYSGSITISAERLDRIGAPPDQALASDWDAVGPDTIDATSSSSNPASTSSNSPPTTLTALRGFGNVLWYPVSAPPLFLGDGARLFQAVGDTKLRQSTATIRLRLAVEYLGDPPDAAFFCGQRGQLIAISDNPNLPAADSPGIATVTFDPQPLGFRTPNLFITAAAPTNTGTPADSTLIAAVTNRYDTLPSYSAAAVLVTPLLTDWLGAEPLIPLTILDHPGQPFEDDALLVRPMRADDPASLAPSLVHSLTHAWIRSSHPWIDEGLAQFMGLLYTERTAGRAAALDQLQDEARILAVAEPAVPASESASTHPDGPTPSISSAGESLAAATGEVFYRTKATAVWWMLRSLLGDDPLKQALQAYRLDPKLDRDPLGLQHTLEKFSHKDLNWFFNDWVYRDRGLPDLSIVNVTPSQTESRGGLPSGWLVAVVVRNDGYAVADVPVTVRSAHQTETQRMRIPGRSELSIRIVFPGTPEQVQVNDGSVPETQTSIHTRELAPPTKQPPA